MTIQEMEEHFYRLYEDRNNTHLETWERIGMAFMGVADLRRAVRKGASQVKLQIALARMASRIFCVTQRFRRTPMPGVFASKYLADACTYCQHSPCICLPGQRPERKLAEVSEEKLGWSMTQCQAHLEKHYGRGNRERGIDWVLLRLFEEMSEILSLVLQMRTWNKGRDQLIFKIAEECADALAWTFALAYMLEINLEEALRERYGNGCWRCHQLPCECGPFKFEEVDWADLPDHILAGS